MHHYHSALLELNPIKLKERIGRAETEIQKRLRMISAAPSAAGEYVAIRDALQNLKVLQQELAPPENSTSTTSHNHPEISGEYVVFVDANRRYVDVTEGVCSLLGYSRAELLGKTIDDITAPEIKESIPGTFNQYVNSGGLSGEFLLLARNGRKVPIRYDARVFPDGCLVARWEPLASAA